MSAAATASAGPVESRKVYEEKVKPFLEAHCVGCHGEKVTKAGFRIDTLGTDFLAGKTADQWKEIYDNIGVGKMPPKKEPRPDTAQASAVTDWIARELRSAERRAKNSTGRVPTRRLNRREHVNTLGDLFHLDENFVRALEDELPMDGKVDGFDRGGLFIDEAQMTKYLELADLVLSRAVFASKPKTVSRKYLTREIRGDYEHTQLATWQVEFGKKTERKKVALGANYAIPKNGGLEFVGAPPEPYRQAELWGGGMWYRTFNDPLQREFPEGWYRLKFRAGAFKGTGAHAVDELKLTFDFTPNTPIAVKQSVIIDAPLDQPKDFEMRVFLRSGSPDLQKNYRLRWNGCTSVVIRNPIITRLEDEYGKKYRFKLANLTRLKRPQAELDEVKKQIEAFHEHYHKTILEQVDVAQVYNPDVDLKAVPRLWIESFEIEGPLVTWPPKGRTELFFKGEDQPIDEPYIREIFARFLPRAYRRPVEVKELNEIVTWVLKAQKTNNLSGIEAVREGVRAVLCSPNFLILQESAGKGDAPRPLTDYELASRLSYFLWSTMPDAELFDLAGRKQLHEPKTLHAQVRRMLADPRANAFVRNFAGQWLKVEEFNSVITDRRGYPDYDDDFRDASRREPYEFFKEVLGKDLSVLNFVDSDFLVINERLARHYGIEGVKGNAFRKVAIRPEHHRGGVLGMAGVLTYLTDGLRTLPVRRASYVLDTFWNAPPPPPPPNAGDLPPVGRNLTVRQRLEQHRNNAVCASCHTRIDPFGMALENYDAIGAWRERQNGERFKGDAKSPPLDVSGVLPSGRTFTNVQEFKQALLAEKERFLRGFVEKMLTYALGRSVGVTDRETIEAILKAGEAGATDKERYRLHALIQAIVSSQVFQTK
jgi:hypothetical protein